NILAVGLTSYLSGRFLQDPAFNWLNRAGTFAPVKIPVLNRIPVIGPLLFEGNFFFYLTIALVIGLNILLFRTRFGLRVRAVGEQWAAEPGRRTPWGSTRSGCGTRPSCWAGCSRGWAGPTSPSGRWAVSTSR